MKHVLVTTCLLAVGLVAVAPARAQPSSATIRAVDLTASSSKKGRDAWRALDGDWGTAWCEGRKGAGVGEHLEIAAPLGPIHGLVIHAGVQQDEARYANHNRPTKVKLGITDASGTVTTVEVPLSVAEQDDVPGGTTWTPPAPIDAVRIRVELAAVDKGKADDSCITELSILTSVADSYHVPEPADALAALPAAITALRDAFASCDAAALAAHVRFPLTYDPTPDQDGKKPHRKQTWKKAKDLAKACKKGQAPRWIDEDMTLGGVHTEGPGKVRTWVGRFDWWHLVFVKDAWKLRAALPQRVP